MGRRDTNRANLKYASDLRRRGFATAVHALPKETQDYIDSLLSKGWKGHRISNEINKRYGDILPRLGLKPLSFMSINTYRKKYWKKTPALANLILTGDEKTKKEIEKVNEDLDLYSDMVGNKKRHDEFFEKSYSFTKNTPMPAETTVRLNERSFAINRDLLHEQFALGIVSKKSQEVVSSGSVKAEEKLSPRFAKMSMEELIEMMNRTTKALSGHRDYGISEFTGEDLSGLT